ncbi:sodium/glutamate symporter [Oceanobacillus timonensis]|uniref:sodium/glutamate symporter n=1 Tax=Oceanobacillus timonensis TaxID=1926285 RepID=UPI0009B9504E|nr:sodium/glutamate symporter [Oceanobacillus timonensis]
MSLQIVGFAVIILAALLVIGKLIRLKIPILQKLFLPTSLIGGFLALLLGPEVLGRLTTDGFLDAGFFTEEMVEVWAGLPELLINIVFACLFIGFILPKPKKMWRVGGPQIALGYTMSWAQYVVGILLALTVLTPFFGLSPAAGALIEISFVGGHGTAAGLQSTFQELGFSEGYDLAIGLATIGILSGVVIGMIMVNWAARKGKSQTLHHPDEISFEQQTGIINKEHRHSAGTKTTSPLSIEPFAFHLGLIGISIFIGYVLLEALVWLEAVTYGSALDIYLFEYVPLFPFAMIGGIIVQIFISRFDYHELVDRDTINTIQGVALDFLIISAMASLSLQVIGANIIPFILLAVVGIAINVFLFLYLGPKMIPSYWFERGIGDFGQSTGVAATGIMLMRIVDAENQSPALNAFGYKQILFEPMVGGGLVTAASVPFIIQFGAIPVLIAVILLTTAFWLLGTLYFGKMKESD